MANSESTRNAIIIVVLTALLGGSSPFWWKYIFPPTSTPITPTNPDKVPDKVDPAPDQNAGCPPATYPIDSKSINTKDSDAHTISGDNEIDSDDWTGIELSYRIEKVSSDRELRMIITWYAQEKNSDRSTGNTRIMSNKTITLYKVEGCPELVIKDITGIQLKGEKSEDFNGEIHDLVNFPDCGSLQNVRVRFDGDGSNDVSMQRLTASLPGFSVVLGTK